MKTARRMNVDDRNPEDPLEPECAQPTPEALARCGGPSPHHVVALVDRLEQRIDMGARPRIRRRRHQRQRQCRAFEPLPDRTPTIIRDLDHAALGLPSGTRDRLDQRIGNGLRPFGSAEREHDHANPRAANRFPFDVCFEGIDVFVGLGHRTSPRPRAASLRLPSLQANAPRPLDKPPGGPAKSAPPARPRWEFHQSTRSRGFRSSCRRGALRRPRLARAG